MSGTATGRAAIDRAPTSSVSPRAEARPGESASVLVDVGNGKGALVLYLDDGVVDDEIEISPVRSAHRVHTGVLDRHTASGVVRAAVFGSLVAGSYTVWRDARTAAATVTVVAGTVTEWTSDPSAQLGVASA
jgi:hypothetical protein